MATNRPRKNIYLDDAIAEQLRDRAYQERMSESEICREALDLFLNFDESTYNGILAFAMVNQVHHAVVIEQLARKLIPDKYFGSDIDDIL